MQYMYVASCRFLFIIAKRIDNRVGFVKSDNRVLQYSELHFVVNICRNLQILLFIFY